MIFLEKTDLLSDIFKSGQYLDQFYAVIRSDHLCHICGNDGLYQCRILRHGSGCFALTQNILRDQHSGHISGKAYIFSGLCILAVYTKTVSVRVSCKHDIRVFLLCKCKREFPCSRAFRVRIRNGREIAVRFFLFRYYDDLLKAKLF